MGQPIQNLVGDIVYHYPWYMPGPGWFKRQPLARLAGARRGEELSSRFSEGLQLYVINRADFHLA